jgi:ferric-dicitrate binding protein FerR (iron transport regulator)
MTYMTEVPYFFASPQRQVDIAPGDVELVPSDGEARRLMRMHHLAALAAAAGVLWVVWAYINGWFTIEQAFQYVTGAPANDN